MAFFSSLTLPGFKRIRNHTIHVLNLPGLKRNGPTVILLHGLAATSSSWMPLVKQLSCRASRFILCDLPGHGLSPAIEPPFNTLDAYNIVHDVLIREIEPDTPTVIVGNSLGGSFAMRFTLDHPDLITKAILISPAGAPFAPSAKAILETFVITSLADAKKALKKIFVKPSLAIDILAPQLLMTAKHACFVSLIQSMLEYDTDENALIRQLILTPERLAECKVPVQLIWGQKDQVLTTPMRDFFVENLPKNCSCIFPETFGHCPQFEDTLALASLMALDID